MAILDTLKICDTVLFLVSAAGGIDFGAEQIDDWGNKTLMTTFAQVICAFIKITSYIFTFYYFY